MTDFYFEEVVWLSDDGRGSQEVSDGELLEVQVPPHYDVSVWEVVEEGSPTREWAVPVAHVNLWPRRIVTDPP